MGLKWGLGFGAVELHMKGQPLAQLTEFKHCEFDGEKLHQLSKFGQP